MADPVSLSLPALSSSGVVRYKGIPRRYEETRPVFIQGHAHRKILGIGRDLEKRVQEKYDEEKQRAIREAEQAVWAQAEQMKAAAVLKSRDESSIEMERTIKKINRQHEKALKEEALKVEMAMQKLAIEQVKQERAEAEERLKEAVRKTEVRAHQELVEAVEKARDEEMKIAAAEAVKVAKAAQEKFEKAIQIAAEEKKKALKELEERKNKEREKAVAEMEVAQKKIAAEQLEKLKKEYEQINARLKEEIKGKLDIIDKLNLQIICVEKAKKNVEDVLHDTKTDFQDFIDRLPDSIKGQVGYMTRPIYIDEIGRVATII